jgi:hypothetical protein
MSPTRIPCDEVCDWCSYSEHAKCLTRMHIGEDDEHSCICHYRSNGPAGGYTA